MAQRRSALRAFPLIADLSVHERVLANGLKALVLPRRQAPIVVCDLYYPVGASDEPPGRTGVAHFVEHMLFKGTTRFPKGAIDVLAMAAAGQSNAETGDDFTHYWFELPADRWELALAIEADRMVHAAFDPKEVEAERQVIVEERSGELDTPTGRLERAFQATSYQVHPYRNPIIGWPADLERLGVDELRTFYREHYRPEGAVLVVVGDLDPRKAFERIEHYFGAIPGAAHGRSTPPSVREPRQSGLKWFRLDEPDATPRVMMGWHTVPRGHADAAALTVVADLLGCGRRSRLWSRLVEDEKVAIWVDVGHDPARLAGQFVVSAETFPEVEPARFEALIREEIERLAREGPTSGELLRSRRRLEAAWLWGQQDYSALSAGLGQAALWGDWRTWHDEHHAALAATAEELRKATKRYLVDRGLTVGWSLPVAGPREELIRGEPSGPAPRAASGQPALDAWDWPSRPARALIPAFQPTRTTLPNGLRLLTESRPGTGVVALEMFVDAGVLREGKPGVAALTGRLLDEGTQRRTGRQVAEDVEDVGGTLTVHPTGLSLRMRADDLELAIDVLAEIAATPKLPEEPLAWLKRRTITELRGDLDDPFHRAESLFRGMVYGEHPYARDVRGTPRQVAAITIEDIREHHRRWFVPNNVALAVVGDFAPGRLKAILARRLSPWRPLPLEIPRSLAPPPLRARRRSVRCDGEQVHVVLGHLGIRRHDPDFDALAVLDQILGGESGFADRLSRVVRDELGLAYAVTGGLADSADIEPGALRVAISTGPHLYKAAIAAARAELESLHRGEIAAEEFERAVAYLENTYVFNLVGDDQRAEHLIGLERLGLPLDEPLRWPERMRRMTLDDVRQAASRHLHPDKLIRVVAGPTPPNRR